MTENITNVKKKLEAIDQKLLCVLANRIELMPYIAEANYLQNGEKIDFSTKESEIEEQLQKTIPQIKSLAQSRSIQDVEGFVELVIKNFKEILEFSYEEQEKYLKNEFGSN